MVDIRVLTYPGRLGGSNPCETAGVRPPYLRFSRCFPATLLIPIARGEAPTTAMPAMVAYLDVIAHQELRASERKSEVPSSEIELYI